MEAYERKIEDVLAGQLRYRIPRYQRPYSWSKENTEDLLRDIEEAQAGQDKEYFIGSLILINRGPDQPLEVVDGQQRLTTLTLIFARLRHHIQDGAAKHALDSHIWHVPSGYGVSTPRRHDRGGV